MSVSKCKSCELNGNGCYVRSFRELMDFGKTEWECPSCEQVKTITKGKRFKCDNCGFVYECISKA